MKLKRFLLRYDPPGVGLEIEKNQGRTTDVVHKDLPLQDTVRSSDAVRDLADQLIESEPELLTKRRHSEALSQLLCRLYQIELQDEDDRQRAAREAAAASAAAAPKGVPSVQEGQQVVMVGLKGKLQVHNGEVGTVAKAKEDRDKYEVLLASAEPTTVKVKGAEHVMPVSKTGLAVGAHVAIRGLRNHVELNGCLGRIVECHEEGHRFEVRALASGENGQLFRVKHDNVVAIDSAFISSCHSQKENCEPNVVQTTPRGVDAGDPPPTSKGDAMEYDAGAVVQLVGLKTAMQYNGQTAEVISVDRNRGRYEIQMNDGSVKTIRSENVRPAGGATKPSPRPKRQKDPAGGDGQKQKA